MIQRAIAERSRPTAIGIEQKTPITALHHIEAESNEADRAIPQIMALPDPAANVANGEQTICDLAVACVFKLSVEGTKPKDQPVPPGLGYVGEIGSRISTGCTTRCTPGSPVLYRA